MHPLEISAQFAAFLWFTKDKQPSRQLHREASRYAEKNWLTFVPNAHDGVGKLLLKLANPPAADAARRRNPRRVQPKLAVAG